MRKTSDLKRPKGRPSTPRFADALPSARFVALLLLAATILFLALAAANAAAPAAFSHGVATATLPGAAPASRSTPAHHPRASSGRGAPNTSHFQNAAGLRGEIAPTDFNHRCARRMPFTPPC